MTPSPSRSRIEKADISDGLCVAPRLFDSRAAPRNSVYSMSLEPLMSMRRKRLSASSSLIWPAIAMRNSSCVMVPESLVSILLKRVRSSSTLLGGVEKAITSSATFFILSALAKACSDSMTCMFFSISSPMSERSCSSDDVWIHGWASACEALNRFVGSFCMSARQKSLPCCEIRSHSGPMKRTGSWMIMRFFSFRSWWWKGRLPERSMKATTPIAHMSTDESYAFEWSDHSSGAMYEGVPIWSHIDSLPGATSAAKPKSISLSSASSASSS
mmetsp:Transcript_31141/g.65643  ORF Transcript_31141/g.65643 Transcript_31141/m.65643 type:complete len:272 (-) Transcript_31141:734-1549(-)